MLPAVDNRNYLRVCFIWIIMQIRHQLLYSGVQQNFTNFAVRQNLFHFGIFKVSIHCALFSLSAHLTRIGN